MGNLIKQMKDRIAKSGTSKKEVLYFAPDSVKRVRFLQELDTGHMIEFHSDFDTHVYEMCKDPDDHENCKLCNDEIPILENYVWSVWDYDSNAVRLLCMKATGISPIPALIEMFEEFGTIKDRDYKIKKVGKGTGGSFVVTPLDKSTFRNSKAKPYTEKQIREILEKAFASTNDSEDEEDEDEEEEEKVSKKSKKASKKAAPKKKKKPLRSKFEELDMAQLKEICLEIGMSKKEFKAFDDEEEVIEELFSTYEESDLEELLEGLDDEEEDDDEDDED